MQAVANALKQGRTDRKLWVRSAACVDADTEMFFPARGHPSTDARAYCLECPVRVECLAYAVENREAHGVWGGFAEHQRRVIVREVKGW